MNRIVYLGLSFSLLLLFATAAIIGLYNTFFYVIWGSILAYITLPLINRLEKQGIPRPVAIIGVLTCLIISFMVMLVFFADYLYREISDFVNDLPALIEIIMLKIQDYIDQFNWDIDFNVDTAVALLKEQSAKLSNESLKSIFKYSMSILQQSFNSLAAFITTIANFYLLPLLYYHISNESNFIHRVEKVLPASKRALFQQIIFNINTILRQFARGLLMLSLVRAIIFSIGLHLLNLQYGFIIGVLIGLLSIIPYLGIGIGLVICLIVAFATLSSWLSIMLIIGFFSIVLIVDNAWLQERLIERHSNLSQLGVVLAIIICGNLLGTIGVFFAIPLVSIAKYLIDQVLNSYALDSH